MLPVEQLDWSSHMIHLLLLSHKLAIFKREAYFQLLYKREVNLLYALFSPLSDCVESHHDAMCSS